MKRKISDHISHHNEENKDALYEYQNLNSLTKAGEYKSQVKI